LQIYIDFKKKKPNDKVMKIIEQGPKPKLKKLPHLWKQGKESVENFCSLYEWEYVCLDYYDMNAFLLEYYPDLFDAFWDLPYPIQRVDILKYLWLHTFGGVYMDMDFIVTKEFQSYINDLNAPVMVLSSSNMENVITNSFIVANPKQELFIKLSKEALLNESPFWAISTHLQVMLSTGPLAFTKALHKEGLPYLILPHELFFPNNPLLDDKTEVEYEEYIKKVKKSQTSFLLPIKGGTWNSWDTKILNVFNKYRILVIVISSYFFLFQMIKFIFNTNNKNAFLSVIAITCIVCSFSYLTKTQNL
jgi:mannosyltransferase OCH1-like enzyme